MRPVDQRPPHQPIPAATPPVIAGPRLRRLAADFESLRASYSGHPHVRVVPIGPLRPPERYRVTYDGLSGVTGRDDDGRPQLSDTHEIEIVLPLRYPRERPLVRPVTPLFHPNVTFDAFCLQDHWAAEQSLGDIVAKVADMIQFRVYNPQSPLDIDAARWATANPALFPIGNVSVALPDVEIGLGST